MTGVTKTADKLEAKGRKVDPLGPGAQKDWYGKERGLNEEERKEGYAAGKEKKAAREAGAAADKEIADTQAAQAAAEQATVDKSHKSQTDALKRKGRRASILTSSQGAADPLGIPGA